MADMRIKQAAERIFGQLRSGDWLGRARVLGYARVVLVVEILAFALMIAGTHGWIVPLDRPLTTDFASFYAAGDLANAGTPQLAYDKAAHYAAEQRATERGIQYQFFYYPPVFLLICALLARLPYIVAFVAFEAMTLALYAIVGRGVLGERNWQSCLPLLAFPAVFWTLGLGQNALLTAALFGAATLLIDRRPVVAGILFGALCYKPHLGLLVPVALVAAGRWRAVAAAAVTVVALVLASAAAFGWTTWHAYVVAMLGSHSTYEFGRINFAGMISPFAAARLLHGTVAVAYAVQALATLAAIAAVSYVWRRERSIELRGAVLAGASIIAVPVVLLYDLALAAIAAAWLVRAARQTGFLPWEKTTLCALFVLPLLLLSLGSTSHLPLGPVTAVALLALAVIRARADAAASIQASSLTCTSSPITRTG